MGKPIDFEKVAAHLAHPRGKMGVAVAYNMNRSNGDMMRRTVDFLGVNDDDNVLEIGPGNGALADYVHRKAKRVHYIGADISETMVAEANRINQSGIDEGNMRFVLTDGNTLPFVSESFDKVFTVNTLYFWKNPSAQLADIRRVMNVSGVFCLSFASRTFMERLPFTPYGFRLYTQEEAERLLVDNGFIVEEIHVGNHETSSAAGEWMLRDEIAILASKKKGEKI